MTSAKHAETLGLLPAPDSRSTVPSAFQAMADAVRLLEAHAVGDHVSRYDAAVTARALHAALGAAERPRTVFAPAHSGWWYVGRRGAEQVLHNASLGLRAAHAALAGLHPRCEEYAPGRLNADTIVRRAIRDQAATWAECTAHCPDLAAAMRRMRVVVGRVQSPDVGMFVVCL
jgi:hypothetical protein